MSELAFELPAWVGASGMERWWPTVVAGLAILFVGRWLFRRLRRRRRDALRREPALYRQQPMPGARRYAPPEAPASVFGTGPKPDLPVHLMRVPLRTAWFVAGICVGAAGMAVLGSGINFAPLGAAVSAAIGNFADGTGATDPAQAAVAGVSNVGDAERDRLIGGFVEKLRTQLPLRISPSISMWTAETRRDSVAIGFRVSEAMTPEEREKFRASLESSFRVRVCAMAPAPDNIHGLNSRGVAFVMTYADPAGQEIARLTVRPGFCPPPTEPS